LRDGAGVLSVEMACLLQVRLLTDMSDAFTLRAEAYAPLNTAKKF
jgi:hypothetical protein